jgi:hypothetical protein
MVDPEQMYWCILDTIFCSSAEDIVHCRQIWATVLADKLGLKSKQIQT